MNFLKHLLSGLTIVLLSFSLNATLTITPTKPDGVKEEIESLLKKLNFKLDKDTTTIVTFMKLTKRMKF